MMYLRDACFELLNNDMPANLCLLSSTWLNLQCPSTKSSTDHVRVLHPSKLQDSFLSSVFLGIIVCYSTAFIGQVRFTTANYAKHKTADDSNIVYKIGSLENFGRIQRILTVNNQGRNN